MLAVFARSLRFIAEFAKDHVDVPVDSEMLRKALALSDKQLGHVAMMIRYYGGPWSLSSYSNDGTQFSVTPNDEALFYTHVESFADVVAVRDRLHADKIRISELLSRDWQPPRRTQPRDAPNTGWQKVDRQLSEARERLFTAATEEQFQVVGLLCREALISLAEAVHRVEQHPVGDGVKVSQSDAKRRLEAFFENELAGQSNEQARAHAKTAVSLADALQHKRTADYRTGALCAEATASVVSLAAIVHASSTQHAA